MTAVDVQARLYFESHVTIDPVFDARRDAAEALARKHRFRMAKLIMRKREGDDEVPHEDDAFMTARHKSLLAIRNYTSNLVRDLRDHGFVVRRYKIEDTLLDSNHGDTLPCEYPRV